MYNYELEPVSRILPGLYLGNMSDAERLEQSNPLDIGAVLDVSTESNYQQRAGVIYQRTPFPDGFLIPFDKWLDCMLFIHKHYGVSQRGVLVHCAAGISRSAVIVASYVQHRKRDTFKTLEAALTYVKLCRRIIQPAPAVILSAKRHLQLWPYDGSMDGSNQSGS